jgi:adenine-specific DNA-methyltransferase
MLTVESVKAMCGDDAPLVLLRSLGFPVSPVLVAAEAWRAAGVDVSWNGTSELRLAARMPRLDLFLLTAEGNAEEDRVCKFLSSYEEWNKIIKTIFVYHDRESARISIYDKRSSGGLRRLDVDFRNPSLHSVDRLNLLEISGAPSSAIPRIIDRALDRESVSRRFFERFRTAVTAVARALRESCRCESDEALEGEALLTLSRLLFLSFVQEKGWLAGRRRFLIDHYGVAAGSGREFFSEVLLPLFFGCLNTPRPERTAGALELGSIPYLNGGLFEPSAFELRNPELHVPNDLMGSVLEDLFERFDFRIDERDSAGTHVDPEMLGKVFESLMAASERADSGSFYTPREIVDVLTARSIDEWLTGGDRTLLASTNAAVALRLYERLETITVLDPACGSGAFLLSALGAIEQRMRALSSVAGMTLPADLRQRIVERSLFGVDRNPEAVRLCELRLWLAIVSGTDCAIDDVPPLPNLDRNILQGNSLLSPTDFLGDSRGDIYRDWLVILRAQEELIARYRNASHQERPALARLIRGNDLRLAQELLVRAIEADEEALRVITAPQRDLFGRPVAFDAARFAELQTRIASARAALDRVDEGTLDFFSFDVHFAHVVAEGGFDLIAGNPPWVRNSRIDMASKRMYADRYALFRSAGPESAAFHQPDLSIAFLERALTLRAAGGVVALLMPAKITNAAYAAALRRHIQIRMSIVELIDWSGDARQWFDADTFPLGIVLTEAGGRNETRVSISGETFEIEQCDLSIAGPASPWALVPPAVGAILHRIRGTHAPLAEVLGRDPIMGVKTGDNGRFFIDVAEVGVDIVKTIDGHDIPLDALARCVRGRDVRRWSASDSEWMLWPPAGGWSKVPGWLRRLAEARGVEPSSYRLAYVRPEHVGIKVAWKDLSRGIASAVLPESVHVGARSIPLVPNQTLYSVDAVSLEEAYVLSGLLNSTVADALLVCVAEHAKDSHFRYFARTVGRMPLPRVASGTAMWQRLVRASRRAHHGGAAADLDALVAAAYGVSAAELEVLRRFVERRLGATTAR